MPRKLQLLLALFAAFLFSQSIAQAAPRSAKWDPTFGSRGTVNLPRHGSARYQSTTACTRSISGRIAVFGTFGKSEFPPSLSAAARVSANGAIGKFRSGAVWARTKLIKYEGSSSPLSDGSLLYRAPAAGGAGSTTLIRLDSQGRHDRRFGRRGILRVRGVDEVKVFPIDNGEFVIATQHATTTSVRRYTPRGKLISRFGGASGVQISGTVHGAATFSKSGSVLLSTNRPTRTPAAGIELLSAEGQINGNFNSAGITGGLRVHNGRIFVLVSEQGVSWSVVHYRIAQLNRRGEQVGVSGVVDTRYFSYGGGEPNELDQTFWATPRGVVYAHTEQWNESSTSVRFSLWRTPLSERPVFDRQIKAKRQSEKTSPYFIAEHSVLSADGRYLIACGSSAVAGDAGERRRNVALRRLKL